MLFEKVPGLYGSGVVPSRFEEFKEGIAHLMMKQFFTEEKTKIEAANSPKAILVMSLLGGLMLGTFYSILGTVIMRKVVFR